MNTGTAGPAVRAPASTGSHGASGNGSVALATVLMGSDPGRDGDGVQQASRNVGHEPFAPSEHADVGVLSGSVRASLPCRIRR